jgi:hypothetical protein
MSESKKCSACRLDLPLADFNRDKYATGGLHNQCRRCHAEAVKRSYQRHKESTLARKTEYRNANRGRVRQTDRDYYARNRQERQEYHQEWYARSPHVWKANRAVANAVQRGELAPVHTLACDKCGNPATDYHHPSYAKEDRLNVIPLCRSCHRMVHLTITQPMASAETHSVEAPVCSGMVPTVTFRAAHPGVGLIQDAKPDVACI